MGAVPTRRSVAHVPSGHRLTPLPQVLRTPSLCTQTLLGPWWDHSFFPQTLQRPTLPMLEVEVGSVPSLVFCFGGLMAFLSISGTSAARE